MPKISIIIPVYNTEQYLRQCLDSIVNQTLQDIEIICINDGSTDGSLAILEEYAKKDGRIVVISKPNSGPSNSRNFGMSCAKSGYIMFLDSDDCYSRNACLKMFESIERDESDLAICNVEMLYETDHRLKSADVKNIVFARKDGKECISGDFIYQLPPFVTNKICRKEIIDKYNIYFPAGLYYEDLFFWWSYMTVSKSVSLISEKLVSYRRRLGSTMNKTLNDPGILPLDYLKNLALFYAHLQTYNLLKQYSDLFWKVFINFFRLSYQRLKGEENKSKAVELAASIINAADISCFANFPKPKRDLLLGIKNGKYAARRKEFFLFGIRIYCFENEPFAKTELRLFGLSIYKVKYFKLKDWSSKLYVFGICLKQYK
ncbi:MAG: glycosyltransferase [Elusimicrobiota bacterium]|jgi:glycosyltransferase involved in cell wall biosynthesis|nr:glycosyltransferase [Elusimicrobiota bacterium]